MSAPKLTPIPLILGLGVALHALPVWAQATPTTPVMSFPATNVEVVIDGSKKMQSDRLFINARQCLGSMYGEQDPGTDVETPDESDDGPDDAGTDDAGVDDGGVDAGTKSRAPGLISKAIPGDGSQIQVTVSNIASTPANTAMILEFWMGMDGQDCSTVANRTNPNNNLGNPPCKKVGTPLRTIDTKKQVLTFSAQELFTNPYTLPKPVTCDLQGIWTLYIVPLINATPNQGTPDAALGPTLFVRFEPDFTPLAAVTSVTGGRGETEVRVNWNGASGANQLTQYKVLFDKNSIQTFGTGPCTSENLVANQLLPLDLSTFVQKETKGTSYTVDPSSLGLDFNQRIATAVVSLDAAGNESAVSNVVCVEKVSTTGFWDACNSNEKCKDSFDKCSLSLVGKSSSLGWLGWSLGAFGLALWIRRKRSL